MWNKCGSTYVVDRDRGSIVGIGLLKSGHNFIPAGTPKTGPALHEAAIMFMGGVCVRCGFDDMRALQIDHIRGGGTALGKTGMKGYRLWRSILGGEITDYQVLCANCNWIKRCENKEVHGGRGRIRKTG